MRIESSTKEQDMKAKKTKKRTKGLKKAKKLVATKPLAGPIAGGASLGMD